MTQYATTLEEVLVLRSEVDALRRQVTKARLDTIEECASHLEQKADLLTNSLHCGDDSVTIALAHRKSRQLYEAASIINELALGVTQCP